MAEENEDEAVAVTGRPNDIPIRDAEPAPLGGNSTFAERAKAAKRNTKAVTAEEDEAENKSVTSASKKTTRKSGK